MNIFLVTTYGFDPAFPSRPEQIQARALCRRGHRVSAIEYYDRRYPGQSRRSDWLAPGIAVHRAGSFGFFAPAALLRLLRAARPDVIHIHHLRNLLSFQTVLLARRLRIPVVMTVHGLLHDGDLVQDRERPLEAPLRYENLLQTPADLLRRLGRGAHPRRAFRNYGIHAPLRLLDGLVALSQHERDLLIRLGVAAGRIVVLPNAVDLSAFAAPAAVSPDPAAPTVLFIGQLVPRKGYDILAHAMPLVLQKWPQSRFVLVSHNRQGEAELRRITAAAGVADCFALIGPISEAEKVQCLRSAMVVVAPSRYEGFGIPMIEAMAAGRPIVTTDAPAGNEVVQHEHNGLLVPYADHRALAAAILRLLRDPALADRLGETGRRELGDRFSAEQLARNLEQLYRQSGA
jgi:glycosyltransferase involved in cell wall biosynthesis